MFIPERCIVVHREFRASAAQIPLPAQAALQEQITRFRDHGMLPAGTTLLAPPGTTSSLAFLVPLGDTHLAHFVASPKGDVLALASIVSAAAPATHLRDLRLGINRVTGSLELIVPVERPTDRADPAPEASPDVDPGLFASLSRPDLEALGVPSVLMPSVLALQDRDGLYELLPHLPAPVADRLLALASGSELEEILEPSDTDPVDLEDHRTAAARAASTGDFALLKSDPELEQALADDFESWQVFLREKQRKQVETDHAGPALLLGGAGTGKTVVLMHRAVHLARRMFRGDRDRILILTYTTSLRDEISRGLDRLAGPVRPRIEVQAIHTWARKYLEGLGFDLKSPPSELHDRLWDEVSEALATPDLPAALIRDAHEAVVCSEGYPTLEEFLKAPTRAGDLALTREQKQRIWQAADQVRDRLAEQAFTGYQDQLVLALEHASRMPGGFAYRTVLVDEAQDMGGIEFRLIRAIVPQGRNDLFIVGDPYQRIFQRRGILERCGIDTTGRVITEVANYRNTRAIADLAEGWVREQAVTNFDGRLSKDFRRTIPSRKGQEPEIRRFATFEEELEFLVERLAAHPIEDLDGFCLMTPDRRQLARYRDRLEAFGIPCHVMSLNAERQPGLRMCSMRRSKGLEFRHVMLLGVDEAAFPSHVEPPAVTEASIQLQQRLLYVAATRARDTLVISAVGRLSDLVRRVEEGPRNVREAVELAQARFAEHLTILPSALSSAMDSPFERPNEVLAALEAIAGLAGRLREPASAGSWDSWFKSRGLRYAAQESVTTGTMFRAERTFQVGDRRIYMGRHIKMGGGNDPKGNLRIHFERDDESGKFWVGHVGRHLSNTWTS